MFLLFYFPSEIDLLPNLALHVQGSSVYIADFLTKPSSRQNNLLRSRHSDLEKVMQLVQKKCYRNRC